MKQREYREGQQATENFEEGMKALFSVSKVVVRGVASNEEAMTEPKSLCQFELEGRKCLSPRWSTRHDCAHERHAPDLVCHPFTPAETTAGPPGEGTICTNYADLIVSESAAPVSPEPYMIPCDKHSQIVEGCSGCAQLNHVRGTK